MALGPSNLDALVSDIYVRFVQIQPEDFKLHYRVLDRVFHRLHREMANVDPYYRRYSSTIQFAGSHYDNVRIVKPDEFDKTIVIGLPVCFEPHHSDPALSDVSIEPREAGFVQLRMGRQFQNLYRNVAEWPNNKAAYEWMDDSKYLQSSKFFAWFKGVVSMALNQFEPNCSRPQCHVDGVLYTIGRSESGPAMTLYIENSSRGFKLDVDLVPALKFPATRWPISPSYRRTPTPLADGDWLLVAKPIKKDSVHDKHRSWRIGRPNQERALIRNTGNLRTAWRLIKKLRDSQRMYKVASYFIKNLFFWEIVEKNDLRFWHRTSPADLFKLMVDKLHAALLQKTIPYFWNRNENLLARVQDCILEEYEAKIRPLVQVLRNPHEFRQVARYLLTQEEFGEYNANFLHI